jgi:hypothetical protein
MALKGKREVLQTNTGWKIASGVSAERGAILCGTITDGTAQLITGTLKVGARPIGLLMDDVEDLDFTTRPQIWVRNVVPRGSEVSIMTKGRVKTNMLTIAAAPSGGMKAYLAQSGLVQTATGSGIVVGFFEGQKDADGYVDLFVDIQGR